MKATHLLLKIYGEKRDDQWSLISLDFSLAAQADTLEHARAILNSQIKEYLCDALAGQDRAHAGQLLSRRAPLKYWLKYWYGVTRYRLGYSNGSEHAFTEPLRLLPG